jgi:hypothetical protein
MQILARTYPNQSPYRVSDNGVDIFFCNYKHEAEAFIRGVTYANRKHRQRDLWTDYANRFEVMEKDNLFYVYDHAESVIIGGELFANELEAYDLMEDFIKEEKEQERYYNQSGR